MTDPKGQWLESVRAIRDEIHERVKTWLRRLTSGHDWRVRFGSMDEGSLEMELWGKDAGFRGAAPTVFYSRSGEAITVPSEAF